MSHPPWLRFQAYVLGLPKTGSTSLTTLFGNYRAAHEWRMGELVSAGLRYRNGQTDSDQFWFEVTPRLSQPALEMDSATCHHLYAEELVHRFDHAVFIHSVRDVGGWITSLLDMALRYRLGRARVGHDYTSTELDYIQEMTDGQYDHTAPLDEDDAACIVPLMRYWAEHMHRMARELPADRSLTVRTSALSDQVPQIAELCGIPVETLRKDLAHTNQSPLRFDRMAAFDSSEMRHAYEQHCADIMSRMFPREHEALGSRWGSEAASSWQEHVAATERWVDATIETTGAPVVR